jgi:hypothetical protein
MKLFPEILIHMLNQFILASLTDNMKTETHVEHSEIHKLHICTPYHGKWQGYHK